MAWPRRMCTPISARFGNQTVTKKPDIPPPPLKAYCWKCGKVGIAFHGKRNNLVFVPMRMCEDCVRCPKCTRVLTYQPQHYRRPADGQWSMDSLPGFDEERESLACETCLDVYDIQSPKGGLWRE